jgi:hypothetical protein
VIENEAAKLLRDIREEVIGLLFNRYVFRTHQEIVRQNRSLQRRPRIIFAEWGWTVYAVANAVGVRRVASSTIKDSDVNLVRLLDLLIRNPANLWPRFEECYPDEAASARTAIQAKSGNLESGWEVDACKRLLCEDRKRLINAAKNANWFASKRAAHSVPGAEVRTSFSDLDQAIDTLVQLTEKYTRLTEKVIDLLQEMKSRKLPEGWDSIFLEVWATPEILALNLGERRPPDQRVGPDSRQTGRCG